MNRARSIVGITGATGALGSAWLRRELAADPGLEIVALARDTVRTARQLADLGAEVGSRVLVVPADLRARTLSRATLQAMATVNVAWWHFAAATALGRDEATAAIAAAVNDRGTLALLTALRQMGSEASFFHVSTAYVAGVRTGRVREVLSPLIARFRNPYEQSKAAAEHHVWSFLGEGRRGAVFRPSVIVGDRFDEPAAHVPALVARSLCAAFQGGQRRIQIDLPGSARINLVAREWVIHAMRTIAASGRPPAIYHLTARAETGLSDLAAAMERALPDLRIDFRPGNRPAAVAGSRFLDHILRGVSEYLSAGVEFDRTNLESAFPRVALQEPDLCALLARQGAAITSRSGTEATA